MKFSSTDKWSEAVSLIRNKKNIFSMQKKSIIKKNWVLAFFQTRPQIALHAYYRAIPVWIYIYILEKTHTPSLSAACSASLWSDIVVCF